MNRFLLVLSFFMLPLLPLFAQQKDFHLSGTIKGITNDRVRLYKDTGERLELIDSVSTEDGSFEFSGKCSQSFAAQIRISKFRRAKLFVSPGMLTLKTDASEFKNQFLIGRLQGSEAQNRFEDYQRKLNDNEKKLQKVKLDLESPMAKMDEAVQQMLTAKYEKLKKFKNSYYYQYAKSPVVPYLIYQDYFASKIDLAYIKKQLEFLKLANPQGMYVQNLQKRVLVEEQLGTGGIFPELKERTLAGQEYNLREHRGKPILIYIWRAWNPKNNEKYYNAIKDITQTFPSLEVVSIIRNSSFNKLPIPGTTQIKTWVPEPRYDMNCVEIESLDKSVALVQYLDRNFHAFILDNQGKVVYHQSKFNSEELIKKLTLYLSRQK